MLLKLSGNLHDESFNFIVHNKYQSATSTTENVGESTLEESVGALCLGNGRPAVSGALVDDFALGTARLHHHTPADCVEGIRNNTGNSGDSL